MNLREHAIRGVAWSTVRAWGTHGIQLIVLVILARELGPEIFGAFAIAQATIVFMGLVPTHGFAKALIQRPDLDDADCDAAFWATVVTGFILAGCGVAVAPLIAWVFGRDELAPVIMVLSISVIFLSLSSTQQAILERRFEFKSLALRSLVSSISGGVVAIVMVYSGAGIWSIVGQMVVGSFVSMVTLWSVSTWRPRFRFSMERCRSLLHFGTNTIAIGVLQFMTQQADVLLIGYFVEARILGYYTFAFGIIRRMTDLLTATVSGVALPTFSRMQDDRPRLRDAFYTATRISSLVSVPSYVGLAVIAALLVPSVFGERWADAIPVLQVLTLVGILSSASFFNGPLIMACGHPNWVLRVRVINVALRLAALFITVQTGNIVLVAVGYVIPGYIMLPITLTLIRRLVDLRVATYARQYAAPLVGAASMGGMILGMQALLADHVDVRVLLVASVMLGVFAYPVLIRLFAPRLAAEGLGLVRDALSGGRAAP